MAYFLGIDSGGTKTECWLGDESRVLARSVCGSVKLTRVSTSEAETRLRGLLAEVSTAAGVDLRRVAATCVGMAGYSILELREWMAGVVAECVGGTLGVCGDEEIALDAAFRGGPGILVIAGTGSIVVGRCANGVKLTTGGWGPAIADEGSGYWIGREALRVGLRALDQGRDIELLRAIRMAWGASELGEVVAKAHAQPGPDFAALVPVVVYCAEEGDEAAQRVLLHAGVELAHQVRDVWRRMRERGEGRVAVAYTGSVLEKIAEVRRGMGRRIVAECEGTSIVEPAVNALEGALWRARQGAAGISAAHWDDSGNG